ncbi:MAG: OsmC family protein [Bacteroidia bacterium]|nr:OsmC family protein [Bacteroidia bacterium]
MASVSLQLTQHASTSMKLEHDQFSIIVDRPESKGGGGQGLMGGQYLLIGVGGCFCSNLFAAAQARSIEIEGLSVGIQADLSEDARKSFSRIELRVSYTSCSDEAEFPKLIRIAEKGCLSVNTLLKGAEVQVLG